MSSWGRTQWGRTRHGVKPVSFHASYCITCNTTDLFFNVTDILSGDIVALNYLELQIVENAVIVLNKNGTEFFMRDFNSQKKILWVSNSHTL